MESSKPTCVNNGREPAGQSTKGVAFFGYFFLLQKKSDSPTGEKHCQQVENAKRLAQTEKSRIQINKNLTCLYDFRKVANR